MKIKNILVGVVAITVCAIQSFAGSVSLAWDAPSNSGATAYNLYGWFSTKAIDKPSATLVRKIAVTETNIVITDITAGVWIFTMTASDDIGNVSIDSNYLTNTVITVLSPISNLRLK